STYWRSGTQAGIQRPALAGAKQTLVSCAKLNGPYTISNRGSLDRAQANLAFVGVHSLSCDAKWPRGVAESCKDFQNKRIERKSGLLRRQGNIRSRIHRAYTRSAQPVS